MLGGEGQPQMLEHENKIYHRMTQHNSKEDINA